MDIISNFLEIFVEETDRFVLGAVAVVALVAVALLLFLLLQRLAPVRVAILNIFTGLFGIFLVNYLLFVLLALVAHFLVAESLFLSALALLADGALLLRLGSAVGVETLQMLHQNTTPYRPVFLVLALLAVSVLLLAVLLEGGDDGGGGEGLLESAHLLLASLLVAALRLRDLAETAGHVAELGGVLFHQNVQLALLALADGRGTRGDRRLHAVQVLRRRLLLLLREADGLPEGGALHEDRLRRLRRRAALRGGARREQRTVLLRRRRRRGLPADGAARSVRRRAQTRRHLSRHRAGTVSTVGLRGGNLGMWIPAQDLLPDSVVVGEPRGHGPPWLLEEPAAAATSCSSLTQTSDSGSPREWRNRGSRAWPKTLPGRRASWQRRQQAAKNSERG